MGTAFSDMISSKAFWIMVAVCVALGLDSLGVFLGALALVVIGWLVVETAMFNSLDKRINKGIAQENEEIERKNKEEQKKAAADAAAFLL